jgi:hypothetical protein
MLTASQYFVGAVFKENSESGYARLEQESGSTSGAGYSEGRPLQTLKLSKFGEK